MYTIYRIENSEGVGPYMRKGEFFYRNEMAVSHSNQNTHPYRSYDLAGEDLSYDQKDLLYCACPSKQLLYKWFYGWITKLKKENFFVVKITVSNYIMGNSGKQCFFKQEDVISKEII